MARLNVPGKRGLSRLPSLGFVRCFQTKVGRLRSCIEALALLVLWAGLSAPAFAGAWEKHLLVLPLKPVQAEAQAAAWFGWAFRDALEQAFLTYPAVAFLKNDELASIVKEYKIDQTLGDPEPGWMEKIADDKELALIYGTFSRHGHTLKLNCRVVPGRGEEPRTFSVSGTDSQLRALFAQVLKETFSQLDCKPTEAARAEMRFSPGTNLWTALEAYTRAMEGMRLASTAGGEPAKISARLEQAVKIDPAFVSARAQKITLKLSQNEGDLGKQAKHLAALSTELAGAAELEPDNPFLAQARLGILLGQRQYKPALELGRQTLEKHPTYYPLYLLTARACLGDGQWGEAKQVLLKALAQQGTALQKKPFHLELGLLLLNREDRLAEGYLKEVLLLEPQNPSLHYWRALALFNLGRWLDALDEIQEAEAKKQSEDLKLLKAKTTLALGNDALKGGDLNRAYSFTTQAYKLRPRHFETNLLMAKVLRKKGYPEEARKQVDAARALADPQRARDHFLVGTEYVAQSCKEEGAQEYVTYLKLNPQAPERDQLIQYIRKLRGADEDEGD